MEAKLQEPAEHLQKCDYVGILHVPDKHLWDQLWAKEKEVESASQRAEVVDGMFKKLKDRVELAKTEI